MVKKSLGLIETVGLVAAIEAADAAVKAANVTLVGYETTNGQGLVTVKLLGDVGAVNAAVAAGADSAARLGSVFSKRVIARPADGVEPMVTSKETVGQPVKGKQKTANSGSFAQSAQEIRKVKNSPAKEKADTKPNTTKE